MGFNGVRIGLNGVVSGRTAEANHVLSGVAYSRRAEDESRVGAVSAANPPQSTKDHR